MSQRYLMPAERHRVEEEILRSRFITTIQAAPTVESARTFIAEIKAEFSDASHNCWAYLVGPPGSTAQVGYSDDGEPHGTAGRPMFTVLQHSELGDVVVVVTRYFGGKLLGKGGLVKAYTGGVQLALATLPVQEYVPRQSLRIVVDYASIMAMQALLPSFEAEVLEAEYAVDVTFRLSVPVAKSSDLQQALVEITQGGVLIEVSD